MDAEKPVEELDPTKTDEVEEEVAAEAEVKQEGGEPKPGTPDKALQRMQQELGNVTRQLAALTEKKESGHELTEADKAKLVKAQERLDSIRRMANAGDEVAEHVLEITEKVSKQDALEKRNAELERRLKLLENDRSWDKANKKYEGLDTDAIWKKAVSDAEETLGDEGTLKAIERVASRTFEKRCDAALKRMKEKADPKSAANNAETATGKYRVGTAQATAPQLSEDEAVLAEARSLVREI